MRQVASPALSMYIPRALTLRRVVPAGTFCWTINWPSMVKIFTCIGRGVVTYIVRPRTTTSISPSSVADMVERTAIPGRDATGMAAARSLPTSMATVIITAYLIAFNFTPQSYKKSANRRSCQSIKSELSHQKRFVTPTTDDIASASYVLSLCFVASTVMSRCCISLLPRPTRRDGGGATPRLHRPPIYGNTAACL